MVVQGVPGPDVGHDGGQNVTQQPEETMTASLIRLHTWVTGGPRCGGLMWQWPGREPGGGAWAERDLG